MGFAGSCVLDSCTFCENSSYKEDFIKGARDERQRAEKKEASSTKGCNPSYQRRTFYLV